MRLLTGESAREARRVWVPLVLLSMSAVVAYMLIRDLRMEELGRSVLFDVVMTIAVLGTTAFAGIIGFMIADPARENDTNGSVGEGNCFLGAVIGVVIFFVIMVVY